jgi:hypothetical protein
MTEDTKENIRYGLTLAFGLAGIALLVAGVYERDLAWVAASFVCFWMVEKS